MPNVTPTNLIESDAFFIKKVMKLISPLPATPKIFKQVESIFKSKSPLWKRSPIKCKVSCLFISPSPRLDASLRKKTIPFKIPTQQSSIKPPC